jgi:hypothetical protein
MRTPNGEPSADANQSLVKKKLLRKAKGPNQNIRVATQPVFFTS